MYLLDSFTDRSVYTNVSIHRHYFITGVRGKFRYNNSSDEHSTHPNSCPVSPPVPHGPSRLSKSPF